MSKEQSRKAKALAEGSTPVELPYRPCVGIVLLSPSGRVFVGERHGGEEAAGMPKPWQLPQGGIDDKEDPAEAARRELYEETGIHTVSLLAEAPEWLRYDLPPELVGKAWKGRYRGQIQKWFAFRFDGDETEIDVRNPPDGHKPEFASWRWEDIERLPDLVVPFKREVYEKIVAIFRPLTTA